MENGITVHVAVRNPDNDNKVGHLKEIAKNATGELKFFKADLLTPNAYKEAIQGCELEYHTALPFTINVKDPQNE